MKTSAPPSTGRVAGAAALIAVLTVLSRLAGFGRTAVFTWVISDTDLGAVYVVANTVPNIIFEIVAGGALASLVVPLLAGAVEAGDRPAVARTTAALLTWTVSLLLPLALLVLLFARPVIGLLGDAPSPAELDTGARMLRLFAPQVPLYGIGIVLTGVLQAHRRFAWPVIAPLLSSVTVITTYLLFALAEGRAATIAETSVSGQVLLAGGTTAGVVVLSLCLFVPMRALRLRLRPTYRLDPAVRSRIGGLALAGAVAVIGQQVALLVSLRLLWAGPVGSPVRYNLAQAMYLLPWAVLAVPLAVAAYPTLVAAHGAGDRDTYRRTLAPTVRGVVVFGCLGAALLVGTARPVAAFFLEPAAVPPTAAAIAGFAPGLLGYGLFAVLSRALYAVGATRAATRATAVGWLAVPVAATGLALLLPRADRVLAVTLGNSVGMVVLGTLLLAAVARLAGRETLVGLGRAAAAALAAGGVAAIAGTLLVDVTTVDTPTRAGALLQGMLSGAVVTAIFLAVAYLLDRRDVRPLLAGPVRKIGKITGRGRSRRPEGAGATGTEETPPERGDGKETVSR